MDLQSFNLDNSSVLSEDELFLLLGGKITKPKPDQETDKCDK